MTTLTQTKGLRRGLDLKVGAGLNVFRVNKPTRLNRIWERRSGVKNYFISLSRSTTANPHLGYLRKG